MVKLFLDEVYNPQVVHSYQPQVGAVGLYKSRDKHVVYHQETYDVTQRSSTVELHICIKKHNQFQLCRTDVPLHGRNVSGYNIYTVLLPISYDKYLFIARKYKKKMLESLDKQPFISTHPMARCTIKVLTDIDTNIKAQFVFAGCNSL